MKLDWIIFFLGVSMILYALLGGADFGAGILELFVTRRLPQNQKDIISHVLGPVWEANHMWLILAIVILFNGFPQAFSQISITFHIPIAFMLLGIVLRGCAFTFRHYDAIKDQSQTFYSYLFRFSSILAPLALGITGGGIIFSSPPHEGSDFYTSFISPWFNFPSLMTGIFVCSLFAFLAAVYLTGETEDLKTQSIFIRGALVSNLVAIFSGGLLFIVAWLHKTHLPQLFFSNPMSIFCLGGATFLLVPLWWSLLRTQYSLISRILVGAQISLVIIGWFSIHFPKIYGPLTFYNTAAPETTLTYLLYALGVGSILIFPALYYLLVIFKLKQRKRVNQV